MTDLDLSEPLRDLIVRSDLSSRRRSEPRKLSLPKISRCTPRFTSDGFCLETAARQVTFGPDSKQHASNMSSKALMLQRTAKYISQPCRISALYMLWAKQDTTAENTVYTTFAHRSVRESGSVF